MADGPDRGPMTHDFELLDLPSCAAIELHMDPTGKVWFNVNGKCLFRAGDVVSIEITDNRKRKKRSN